MITKKELEHIALLSRLELSKDDEDKYEPQINSVIDYFSELDNVDTEDVKPTYHVLVLNNVFREDSSTKSLSQENVLSNASKKQEGFFKVPRMM